MKKLCVLFMAVVFGSFVLQSCGGGTEKKQEAQTAEEKEETKGKPGLSLKFNDDAVEFDNVEFSYDQRFGNQITISGFPKADSETSGAITMASATFSINIEDISTGEQDLTHISYKNFRVSDAKSTIHKLEIGSGMFGAVIDEIALDFSATLQDGHGETHKLTGRYTK